LVCQLKNCSTKGIKKKKKRPSPRVCWQDDCNIEFFCRCLPGRNAFILAFFTIIF
jgi:hypothetical protein